MIVKNIIVATSYNTPEMIRKVSEYGVKYYILKPFELNDLENRCINFCYRVRLEKTVQYAKDNGYDAFSTTLLISQYQQQEELKSCAGFYFSYRYTFTFTFSPIIPVGFTNKIIISIENEIASAN